MREAGLLEMNELGGRQACNRRGALRVQSHLFLCRPRQEERVEKRPEVSGTSPFHSSRPAAHLPHTVAKRWQLWRIGLAGAKIVFVVWINWQR